MIIVSQDKDVIINFDNIVNLVVIQNAIVSISDVEKTTGIAIAEYATEERAKEVLQEIIVAYTNTELIKLPNLKIKREISTAELYKNICYQMPEEV